jgi:hypothetical protein
MPWKSKVLLILITICGDWICLSTWFCMINQTHSSLYVGAVSAVRFFHPSASAVISSRNLLSSMWTLTSALKQHKTYATPRPSIFTETEKGSMRCSVQEKRDYMIGYGCILDRLASTSVVSWTIYAECNYVVVSPNFYLSNSMFQRTLSTSLCVSHNYLLFEWRGSSAATAVVTWESCSAFSQVTVAAAAAAAAAVV